LREFAELKVWEKAHLLTLAVYDATKCFPKEGIFALTNQIRRAAYSVPSNIAEGCGRDSIPELAQFCKIAMGSASELEYQLLLSRDLGYMNRSAYDSLSRDVVEVKKMLRSFLSRLKG
jgi:four helix bundle protein